MIPAKTSDNATNVARAGRKTKIVD
jgi:hypothetical protein